MDDDARLEVLRRGTVLQRLPDVPELVLNLTAEGTPLWDATDEDLHAWGVPAPFWAFAWPGGQAVARYLLDHPEEVAGRRVLDLAAGSGICGIAAALAGARSVLAADTDPFCEAAVTANADANGVEVAVTSVDLTAGRLPRDVQVVVAGDVCYEHAMAVRVVPWLRDAAAGGARVLLGDPRRRYLPDVGLELLGEYDLLTVPEVPDAEVGRSGVFAVLPEVSRAPS